MATSAVLKDKEMRKFLKNISNNFGKIKNRKKKYVARLSAIAFEDVQNHFKKQEGPRGKWKRWSPAYRKSQAKRGRSDAKNILKDNGILRNGFQPGNVRKSKSGILWFNPVSYAKRHDEGLKGMPQRQFMWLSKKALEEMSKTTLMFLLEQKGSR